MYDLRHFRPALFLAVFAGLCGYSLAAETPGLWVVSVAALAVNVWLTMTGRFQPMPRWLANALSILAVFWSVGQIAAAGSMPRLILVGVGQFLSLTLLVKLYEQRNNRDYAQILILSSLLMVSGAVMTDQLFFAVLFATFLVLAFFSSLLFNLKVETDRARQAMVIPEDKLSPLTLRQDLRFLLRSMRRVTVAVTIVACACGAAVFVAFPRSPAGTFLGQFQIRANSSMTGFSDQVSFDQISQIRQNEDVVAHLTVWRNEKPVEGSASIYLRGLTLDTYAMDRERAVPRPSWTRNATQSPKGFYSLPDSWLSGGEIHPPAVDVWRQYVLLNPTGAKYLFAMPGLMRRIHNGIAVPAIRLSRPMGINFQPGWRPLTSSSTRPSTQPIDYFPFGDDSLQVPQVGLQLEYEALSVNGPIPDQTAALSQAGKWLGPGSDAEVLRQVRQYGVEQGLLTESTEPMLPNQYEGVARRIEAHLLSHFRYTLDLTYEAAQFQDMDPIVAFLTRVRKGHCEYFASAMTLMCQSAGIPARMVVGFRAGGDAFNPVGGYYIIRESNAHSWVEVLTPRGWVTFDPTSGRDANSGPASLWQALKHYIDFLQYQWAEHVVAFDNTDRDKFYSYLDQAFTDFAVWLHGVVRQLRDFRNLGFFEKPTFWQFFLRGILFLIVFGTSAIFALVAYYLARRHRLRQRAARIGLDRLPVPTQVRLARQLAFYEQLTLLMAARGIRRPLQMTPREWTKSLVYLPGQAQETAIRMTEILYRVRFGQTTLTPRRQEHLVAAVANLRRQLVSANG
jgi:protein-glutamine gamma-glutamyltransferase